MLKYQIAMLCVIVALAVSAIAMRTAELESVGDSAVLSRAPYLQLSTPTSIVIRWRTDVPTDSRVQFGLGVDNLTMTVDQPELVTEHEVHLTDLEPGTRYYYAVGSTTTMLAGNDADHSFTSAPAAGSTKPVRVWVIGDSGLGNQGAKDVRDSYLNYTDDQPADLVITLGDNAYLIGNDRDFQNNFFGIYPTILRNTPVFTSVGNHDAFSADSDTQTGVYFDTFTLPDAAQAGGVASGTEAYYSFEYANIHFICLETSETDFTPGSPMLTWLASDLAQSSGQWTIAFFHHPPYSDGHNSDNEQDLVQIRQNIVPILEAGGVDLVLAGHSHSYERSYFLNGHYGLSNTLDPSMILDGGDGRIEGDGPYTKAAPGRTPNSGTVYAVAGNGSQVTGTERDHPAMHTSLLELGSMVLDITPTQLNAVSIDDQGVTNDSFTIAKPTPPNPCPADLNGDGLLDFFDISEFLATQPDWNNDTAFDFFDINNYLTAYSAGCP